MGSAGQVRDEGSPICVAGMRCSRSRRRHDDEAIFGQARGRGMGGRAHGSLCTINGKAAAGRTHTGAERPALDWLVTRGEI